MSRWMKDPDSVLDYTLDWSAWLDDGDTIDTATVTVASGDVTVDSVDTTTTAVTAWVSAGTENTKARLTYRVTTAGGRTDDRSVILDIRER